MFTAYISDHNQLHMNEALYQDRLKNSPRFRWSRADITDCDIHLAQTDYPALSTTQEDDL